MDTHIHDLNNYLIPTVILTDDFYIYNTKYTAIGSMITK